ncbi:hypothetical protein JCM10212_000770 [Sporobolomyces blumeae]
MIDDPALAYPTPQPTPVLKFESPPSSSSLSLSPASDPTSSTSPSPFLDLCERVDDAKPVVEGPPKRTTPCERCRQVRRACRWDEGSKSCVRCSEAGIACSGPKRRPRPAHEMIVSVAARRELPVVEIGPSSPESRWSTLHLSYSLQYQLVEAAFDLLGTSIDFGIVDYPNFVARFRLAQGRHDEFDAIDQLFATAQMAVAGHFTTHSAFLRSAKAVPTLESLKGPGAYDARLCEVGLARREPLATIAARILRKTAEQLALPFATMQEATDKLAIVLFALGFVGDSIEFVHDHLSLLVQILVPPTDLWFVFDPQNPLAEAPFRAFRNGWLPSLAAVWNHLQHVLAFAPVAATRKAVRYCWRRTEELLIVYSTMIARIVDDPRFLTVEHPRPRLCSVNLIYDETESLRILWMCHLKLTSALDNGETDLHHPHRDYSRRFPLSEVVISSSTFHRRAARLFEQWQKNDGDAAPLGEIDYLLIVAGNSDEENPYRKGSAVQTYLLGYEFPSTLMLLGKGKVNFVVSASKAKLLQPITNAPSNADGKVEVEILTRSKDDAENKKLFERIIEIIGNGNKVGTLPKDKMVGKFVQEWQRVVEGAGADFKEVDVSLGVSTLLAVKDSEELRNERNAAMMTNKLMSHFSDAMSNYIDEGKKVTHEQLGEEIEQKLEDTKFWRKVDLGDGFETGYGDWCYSPIIQSGGRYDLKSSAQTDDARLKAGVILCSLGIRYKSYCSNVGRTFMIDPDAQQEKNYLFLVDLQKFALGQLKDGVVAKDVYQSIVDKIQADRPDLVQYFAKTAGFGMGLEFRDGAYPLGPKGTRTVKADMIFSLTLGFNGIPDGKGATYAVSLVDTVQVGKNDSKILSEGMKSKDDVMFYMEEDEKKPSTSAPANKENGSRRKPAAATAVVKSKLRNENREVDMGAAVRRKQHQRELAARRQDEGLEKYSVDGGGTGGNREKQWRRFESYVKDTQLPEAVASQRIVVDARRTTVILPINGFAVPFHVNTLKSLIKQEEGDYTVLRFMFTTPGAITGKKEDTPFEDPNATFIRGITYRSIDSFRFAELHKEINDLKKVAVKRENERKELADVVEQDRLVEIKGKRPIKLTEVQLRPSFDGKRQTGDVEIHSNGIRYQSSSRSDQKLDILFSNIKHLLFQPCDNELIVVLHIHLKSPIIIGKKKAKDVQFFREVSDASFDETGNKKRKRNYHDEDELEAEQEERKRRADLNKYFKAFSDKIAEASNGRVDVDIPFRELGFQGVPFRSNVLLQPTTDTLVFLTEPPFLVVTLSEIEIAHLERVQYGLKNFDLVFVFQDFTRTPIHINTIPMNQLDSVKEWLDSVDIPFSEGPVNLNWQAIMKTVNDDPYDFFKEGGWSFLSEQEDAAGSSESEEGSEFEADSDVFEDESDEDESEFSDGASESDSGSGEDLSDEGEDWSDAEERLASKERRGDSSDDDRGKKSKSKTKGKR